MILVAGAIMQAQVAIGKSDIQGSSLLDFAAGTTKGIILPKVTTLPTGAAATNGTILIDASTKASSKVVMRVNGAWQDMSDAQDLSALTFNSSPEVTKGAIIGAYTSAAEGVLVLESSSKALTLPKVSNTETDVKSPTAGMMCYDLASKCLAVFDGVKWNYWK
ncbi:hypothetical protein [Flavobacterium branchiophilum]|uniref:Uncharacterized protein n=1 Tax=Flavobacterium branchiophilum TaxID=55197 RepID=A0A2H3KA08_9FLAO|nr:hypothetical protein [Flavobacterium branchiophilum]PDS21882.1 hypothetical protein B0A77_14850 [Flavobacterium branchiophilum]